MEKHSDESVFDPQFASSTIMALNYDGFQRSVHFTSLLNLPSDQYQADKLKFIIRNFETKQLQNNW
jgi:hypothetical protein